MEKFYWRCNVCGDIHYGNSAPEICPTCHQKDTYTKITKEEAKKLMGM